MSNDYKIDGRPPTIFRTIKSKDNPYVMIDRRPIDNPKLSFKAKGILTYLMSRPDGWEVSVTDLVKHGEDGEHAVRAGLKELKEAGHMKYTQSRDQGRITGWLIEVYEVPNPTLVNQPDRGFQDVDNQDVDNRGQVLLTLSNNDSHHNDDDDDDLQAIIKTYESNFGMVTPLMKDTLQKAMSEFPPEWFEPAFKLAVENGARRWPYVAKILENWKINGYAYRPGDDKKAAPAPQPVYPPAPAYTPPTPEQAAVIAKIQADFHASRAARLEAARLAELEAS